MKILEHNQRSCIRDIDISISLFWWQTMFQAEHLNTKLQYRKRWSIFCKISSTWLWKLIFKHFIKVFDDRSFLSEIWMLDKTDAESENCCIQFFIIDILEIHHVSEINQIFSLFWQKHDLAVFQFKCSSAKQNQLHSDICIILHLDIIFSKRFFMRLFLLMISYYRDRNSGYFI